jgi:Fic family protein
MRVSPPSTRCRNPPPDKFIHPVVRAIILHFMIGCGHLFVDGNGRTARALFYWSVLHQKYRLMEFISISCIGRGKAYVAPSDLTERLQGKKGSS